MIKFDFSKYQNKDFGCLKVIEYSHYDKEKKLNFVKVICKNCKNIFFISTNRLRCVKHDYCIKCKSNREKKRTNKRLSRIYQNIKSRCYNPKTNRYYCYGAKGIKICDEWKNNYKSFEDWALNNGYQENLTIDRIDNNGNYEPSNCRWATYAEQRLNCSNNRIIEINGCKKTITEWCKYYNINYYIVNNRLNKYGWDIVSSLTTPIRKTREFLFKGKLMTISQISEKTNIPKYTLQKYLRNKENLDDKTWNKLEKFYKKEK